ncbi:hypothetical protein HELRODRAFT_158765 [Helobdella robusta]|uniref:Uncharacterized protein n=1 Tax=Helobdella robusta TaxID=6412 RepID=T1EN84_HELRO|nr:hypothetical protein HELRODRAFT_158765 [Helobdella robusta]ESO12283.1 hypothetical protein HELRODRAFT_158765 [Helobdella robusta]
MNFENRWVLRSALNFASDGEIVREVGREFQRKGPEKAKADLAKECLTRVKKKREEEDDRKPGRLENSLSKLEGSRSREQVVDDIELIILVSSKRFIGVNTEKDSVRSSMNFENRWVLRSALNFANDGEVVREVGKEFQRKGPGKAKTDLAKECLTRVKKKREEDDDRKPGRLGSINISDKYLGNNSDRDLYMNVQILKIILYGSQCKRTRYGDI